MGEQLATVSRTAKPLYCLSALNASWKAKLPSGLCPSKDRPKKTFGGTPSSTNPGIFLKAEFYVVKTDIREAFRGMTVTEVLGRSGQNGIASQRGPEGRVPPEDED